MKKWKFEDKNTHVLFQQVAHLYVAIPVSACQPTFFACSHASIVLSFPIYCFGSNLSDPDVSFRGLGCRNPGACLCSKAKECGFLLSDSCSRRHFLRPVGSSLLADVCFHFTLCFFLLIALEAMFFGLKACVSWEPNSCRTYLTKQLSLLYPVHTRCPPWPRLGHAPRAISCARHDGIFLAYPFKKFRTTWKPACFGRGNGYKAFTQLAREAYRCVPVRA